VDDLVPVSSPEVAETSKLVENTFRFINISFVNEIALLCDRIGISVWEVIDAAATSRSRSCPTIRARAWAGTASDRAVLPEAVAQQHA